MKIRRLAISAAVGVAVATGLGAATYTSAPAGIGKAPVYIVACPGGGSGIQARPRIKPEQIVLACADYGTLIRMAKWTHWGDATTTTTSARLWLNDCTPDCADGTFHGEPAKAIVTRIVKHRGVRYYTRMRVVPTAPNPLGYTTMTYDFPT
jgi:hypothetical protein